MNETARYKCVLKLPDSLNETAVRLAKADCVSLNQWIVAAVAQKSALFRLRTSFLYGAPPKLSPAIWGATLTARRMCLRFPMTNCLTHDC